MYIRTVLREILNNIKKFNYYIFNTMKKTLILVGVLAMSYTYAQQGKVGVNTEAPQATFEVAPSTANALATATTNEGIIAPKLTKTRIANIATPVEGTLVYATDNTYAGSDAKVAKITEKGYYFYNGTEWVKASGDAAGATLPTTATNGQVLKWNGTSWVAQADANTTYTGSTSVVLSGTSFQRAALTGDVTSAQNNNTVTINNGAVTGAKIAAGTITADKLAPGVIPATQAEVDGIIGNEVTNATASKGLVRAGAGTNADPYTLGVADGGITNAMIANNAVTGAKIANATITADKLAAGVIPVEVDAIIGNEVTNATANRGLVRAGSGTTAAPYTLGIADNGISTAMIANNAITAAKLNQMGAANGQVLKWNGTAWAPAADNAGTGGTTLPNGTAVGDILEWNGSAWVAKTPAATTAGETATSSFTRNIRVESNATTTIAANDYYIHFTSAGMRNLDLPSPASSKGRTLCFYNENAMNIELNPRPLGQVQDVPQGVATCFISSGVNWISSSGH